MFAKDCKYRNILKYAKTSIKNPVPYLCRHGGVFPCRIGRGAGHNAHHLPHQLMEDEGEEDNGQEAE